MAAQLLFAAKNMSDERNSAISAHPARQLWVLWRYWMLRELKTRYAGSVLGVAWAFVQPLATLAIFYVLFGLVLAVRVPGLEVSNGYLLHLLAGLAIWLPFTDAIGRGVGSLVAYEDFLRKQPMPAEILPAISVGGSLLILVVGYGMLLIVSIVHGVGPRIAWLWIPVLLVAQLAVTFGLTLLFSMAHFLWRDVGSMVAFGLQLWFYLTPVVYPLSQIPESFHGWFLLNPLACLVLVTQAVVLHLPMPIWTVPVLIIWVILLAAGGWLFFRSMKPALGEAL